MVRNKKLGSNWLIAKGFDTLREKKEHWDPLKSIVRPSVHNVWRFRRLFREKFIADVHQRFVFEILQITHLLIVGMSICDNFQPTGSNLKEIDS